MNWRRIPTCIVVLFVLSLSFCFLLRDSQPTYHNRKLIEWLVLAQSRQFQIAYHPRMIGTNVGSVVLTSSRSDTTKIEAEEAIRAIGTNAIPTLLELLKSRSNQRSLKSKVARLLARLPDPLRPKKLVFAWSGGADQMSPMLGALGFRVLGNRAEPAIPELVKLAHPDDPIGSDRILRILGQLKQPAAPSLARFLDASQPAVVRRIALRELEGMRSDAGAATLAITRCLTSPDQQLAMQAAATLAYARSHPEIAVPALITALDDPRAPVRKSAIRTLGYYGTDACGAVPKLEQLAVSPDPAAAELIPKTLRAIKLEYSTNWPGGPLEPPPLSDDP